MPQKKNALTYEGILEMLRQTAEQQKENAAQQKETDRLIQELRREQKENAAQLKETGKKISALGSRIGEIVEHMVKGNIVGKFQALGYDITEYNPIRRSRRNRSAAGRIPAKRMVIGFNARNV